MATRILTGRYCYPHFQAGRRGSERLGDLLTVAQVRGSRVIFLTLLLTCKDPMKWRRCKAV